MQKQLVVNAPKARCYKCGSSDVKHVCHHCGNPMCSSHYFPVPRNKQGKLLSTEFKVLSVDEDCGYEPFHCERCFHVNRGPAWKVIIAGIAIVFTSIFLVPNSKFGMKFLAFLAGGGTIAYGVYTTQKNNEELRKLHPPLPIFPKKIDLMLLEKLSSEISLSSEGQYDSSVKFRRGLLDIEISLAEGERDRLETYRKIYDEPELYHAGFAQLKGSSGVLFDVSTVDESSYTKSNLKSNSLIFPLVDYVKNQPLLQGIDQKDSEKKRFAFTYKLREDVDPSFHPIQVIPSFYPNTDQRGIELRVQWHEPQNGNFQLWKKLWNLELDRIELFEINYPTSWGRFSRGYPEDAVIDNSLKKISWKRISINRDDLNKQNKNFRLQFENQIDPKESSITGTIKAVYRGTTSGLQGLELYFPTGRSFRDAREAKGGLEKVRAQRETIFVNTIVEAEFNLSLASLRYQHVRSIPSAPGERQDINNQERLELQFSGVSPDHNTIIAVTNAISEENFYIKQVIENRQTERIVNDAKFINQVWTIFGRGYEIIHPIDFQIDLIGQQEGDNFYTAVPELRSTSIRLTVKGSYSNDDMSAQIENTWERLRNLIVEVMQDLSIYSSKPLPSSKTEFVSDDSELIDAEVIDDSDLETKEDS